MFRHSNRQGTKTPTEVAWGQTGRKGIGFLLWDDKNNSISKSHNGDNHPSAKDTQAITLYALDGYIEAATGFFSLIKYFSQWEWVDGWNPIQHLRWCCFWRELPGSANDLLHFGSLKIRDFRHFLRDAKSSSYISWESFLHDFNPLPLLIHLGIPVSHFSQWNG